MTLTIYKHTKLKHVLMLWAWERSAVILQVSNWVMQRWVMSIDNEFPILVFHFRQIKKKVTLSLSFAAAHEVHSKSFQVANLQRGRLASESGLHQISRTGIWIFWTFLKEYCYEVQSLRNHTCGTQEAGGGETILVLPNLAPLQINFPKLGPPYPTHWFLMPHKLTFIWHYGRFHDSQE